MMRPRKRIWCVLHFSSYLYEHEHLLTAFSQTPTPKLAITILDTFDTNIATTVQNSEIDTLENAITLSTELHKSSGDFTFFFEETQGRTGETHPLMSTNSAAIIRSFPTLIDSSVWRIRQSREHQSTLSPPARNTSCNCQGSEVVWDWK